MRRYRWIVALASALLTVSAWAQDTNVATDEAEVEASIGLGMSQGYFVLLVIHEANAERFFDGVITGVTAGEKLASLGLAPEGGWHADEEVTRLDLVTAYARLLTVLEGEDAAGVGGAVPEDMTIAELMDKIIEAVRKALTTLTAERQPVSPARPLWREPWPM